MEKSASKIAGFFRETFDISFPLFKIMIPVILVVKILKEAGAVEVLGTLLGPVMQVVGLPGSMGLVWATCMVINIYTGVIVFLSLCAENPLTVAQVTVLATMILIAHSLPIELKIAQGAGVRMPAMACIRIGGALVLGWLMDRIYTLGGWFQEPNTISWIPHATDPSLTAWAIGQLKSLAFIYVVIVFLLLLLKLLGRLGVTDLIARCLRPVLAILGIGPAASTVTIVGMTLGLAYGGGLIIQEARSGRLNKKDILFSLTLMGLCHSIIEDTIVMAVLGAQLSGILFGRVVFTLLGVFLIVRIVAVLSETAFDRFLFREKA